MIMITIDGDIIGGVTKGVITSGGNSTLASWNDGGVGDMDHVRQAQ